MTILNVFSWSHSVDNIIIEYSESSISYTNKYNIKHILNIKIKYVLKFVINSAKYIIFNTF